MNHGQSGHKAQRLRNACSTDAADIFAGEHVDRRGCLREKLLLAHHRGDLLREKILKIKMCNFGDVVLIVRHGGAGKDQRSAEKREKK